MTPKWASVGLLLLAAAASGCGEKPAPKPASTPPAPASAPPPVSAYEAVEVSGGGTIEGQVRLAGKAPALAPRPVTKDNRTCGARAKPSEALMVSHTGAVRNVVVALDGIRRGKRVSSGPSPILDQRGCDYLPHVQALSAGTTLDILNNDDILHNVHGYLDGRETLFNIAMPLKGQKTSKKLEREGVVDLQCDAGHTWMKAYIVVVGHPYFSTTGADGKFSLTDVPEGTYKLKAWHEKLGVLSTDVTVKPGAAAQVAFEYK